MGKISIKINVTMVKLYSRTFYRIHSSIDFVVDVGIAISHCNVSGIMVIIGLVKSLDSLIAIVGLVNDTMLGSIKNYQR